MKPLYIPKGKAKEYGDYAVNIYAGCPHRCYYCFAPNVLHRDREAFHTNVAPRPGLVESLKAQLEREQIKDKLIHLCFTCDPYPTDCDSSVTREVIQIIKESGNHVQILTKGCGTTDFDLLDGNDWYGVTYDGSNSGRYRPQIRLMDLRVAKSLGIRTWVSCEPVLNDVTVLNMLWEWHNVIDKVKIGKLNYHKSNIDWKKFGQNAERLCLELGLDYYIKDSLRKEMEG